MHPTLNRARRQCQPEAERTRRQLGASGISAIVWWIGLPWLHTWGSGRFLGVSRDAQHLVEHIATHRVEGEARSPVFLSAA